MKVTLVPATQSWRADFERHRQVIDRALSDRLTSIDHIGSTSLGDIAAKPIIDILVGLPEGCALDAAVAPMLDAGYTYIQKFNAGMPYRRFFTALVAMRKGPLPQIVGEDDPLAFGRDYDSTANIHVMNRGTYHWTRHIAFRDYLRAHPEVRRAYEALKLKISERDFADPLEYNGFKEDFIAEHQAKAMVWFGHAQARAVGSPP